MELRINAAKTRPVSARHLARRMADLLDEIENEGSGLVVLRYGRPAALLVPLEPTVRRSPRRVAIEELQEEPFEMPELDDTKRRLILEMARCAPNSYNADDWVGDVSEFGRTFVRLELAGLAERSETGQRWLTEMGARVAAKLNP